MTKIVFKCLQCGDCCRNLLKEVFSMVQGLGLSSNEAKLFPKELVAPQMGVGIGTSESGPQYILSYQLKVPTCPFISANNMCQIYKNRPLSCRAFPLVSLGPLGTVLAEDCRFVKDTEKRLERKIDESVTPHIFYAPDEWKARAETDREIMQSFMQHPTDIKLMWVYDLKTKKWEVSG